MSLKILSKTLKMLECSNRKITTTVLKEFIEILLIKEQSAQKYFLRT